MTYDEAAIYHALNSDPKVSELAAKQLLTRQQIFCELSFDPSEDFYSWVAIEYGAEHKTTGFIVTRKSGIWNFEIEYIDPFKKNEWIENQKQKAKEIKPQI
jgi:hypothetical protein